MLSFKNWLENSGPPGGLQPPKQEPTTMPGAWKDFHEPGSEELPPNSDEQFKTKKKKKRRRKSF
jgi:hypothetical protein